MAIHFDAQGRGLYIANSAECGQNRGRMPKENLTQSLKDVTCKRCKKTTAFRYALDALGVGG